MIETSMPRKAQLGVVTAIAIWSLFSHSPLVFAQSMDSAPASDSVAPERAEPLRPPSATLLDYRSVSAPITITMPSIEDARPTSERKPGIPLQIGVAQTVPETHLGDLLGNADWTVLSDGTQVTAITVHSANAGRLRVALRAELPDGARVRFFAPGSCQPSDYPVYSPEDFASRGADRLNAKSAEGPAILWSPIVDGDTLGIEVELSPTTLPINAKLRVINVSHIFPESSMRRNGDTKTYAAMVDEVCPLVDVSCKELSNFPKKAVTRIVFTTPDGKSASCSGTVINTNRPKIDNSQDPYLLTAHHCVATQEVADTTEFDFFYEYQTCDGSRLSNDHVKLRSGARLLVSDPSTDLSLLELRSSLPSGAWLSGWTTRLPDPDSELLSVTHPKGKPQKYSSGNVVAYGVSRVSEFVVDRLQVDWTEGLTLGGSSGGGLWDYHEDDDEWRLIAALSGGLDDESCPTTGSDFGRFDMFYVNEAQPYLSPDDPVDDDHRGALTSSATGILPNSQIVGEIEHRADADMFRIVVTEPGTIITRTTGDTDTVGRLMREDGTVVRADFVGGFSKNFRIAAYVEAGTYYLRVSGWDPNSIGPYQLHTTFTSDSERPAAEIPLFLAGANPDRQGFIRLLNASGNSGTVTVTAIDESGERYGPITLALDPGQTRHFNSDDLEKGNPSKGLTGQTGAGSGDWRLRFDTDLPIEVAAYVRTSDGFLTVVHDETYIYRSTGSHFVSIFNPASNWKRLSKLRLINPNTTREVRVSIIGQDDAGNRGADTVELTLPPSATKTIDAVELESGSPELTGSLGDGRGKWRLWVEAEGDIIVLNLLDSASGHLANLSSPGHIIE